MLRRSPPSLPPSLRLPPSPLALARGRAADGPGKFPPRPGRGGPRPRRPPPPPAAGGSEGRGNGGRRTGCCGGPAPRPPRLTRGPSRSAAPGAGVPLRAGRCGQRRPHPPPPRPSRCPAGGGGAALQRALADIGRRPRPPSAALCGACGGPSRLTGPPTAAPGSSQEPGIALPARPPAQSTSCEDVLGVIQQARGGPADLEEERAPARSTVTKAAAPCQRVPAGVAGSLKETRWGDTLGWDAGSGWGTPARLGLSPKRPVRGTERPPTSHEAAA